MTESASSFAAAVRAAYEAALAEQRPSPAALHWRLTRFDRGLRLAAALEQLGWPVRGLDVADLGAAHGGDACAFVSAGARVICMDFRDYHYRRLQELLGSTLRQPRALTGIVGNATAALPLRNGVAHLALCLNIIEHVPDLEGFFAEVHRILRSGGIAVVIEDVPLKSRGYDGLFQLPFIAVLPMRLRRLIAEGIFGKRYPFPSPTGPFTPRRRFHGRRNAPASSSLRIAIPIRQPRSWSRDGLLPRFG